MIVISGTITMDPVHLDAIVTAVATLETATTAEDGCAAYGFWQSTSIPGHFRVYEEWESSETIDAHIVSPHMATFMGAAGGFGISAMEIWRYDGAERSKFM